MIDETETQLTEADFDEVDREALNRALRMTLDGEDRETAARIRSTLDEEGWFSAAESAAHSQQVLHADFRARIRWLPMGKQRLVVKRQPSFSNEDAEQRADHAFRHRPAGERRGVAKPGSILFGDDLSVAKDDNRACAA